MIYDDRRLGPFVLAAQPERHLLVRRGYEGVLAEMPLVSVAPVISGTPLNGETLTCSTGTWSNAPTSFAYQWKRDGVAISGQTASSYDLVLTDVDADVNCTVTATNTVGSSSADSNTVVPTALPAYTGIISTRAALGATTLGTAKQILIKQRQYVWQSATSIQFLFTDTYGESEAGSGTATTISAHIDIGGTRYRVKFSASNDGTLASGGQLLSDALAVTLPVGWVNIHIFRRNATGIIYSANGGAGNPNATLGDLAQTAASGLTDTTGSGDPDGSSTVIGTTCSIIATTTRPSVLIVGDSKSAGTGGLDGGNASRGDAGEFAQTGSRYAYINTGIPGDHVSNFIAAYTRRVGMAAYASHVLCNWGINDVRDASPLNTIKRNLLQAWMLLRGAMLLNSFFDGGTPTDTTAYWYGTASTIPTGTTALSATIIASGAHSFELAIVNSSNEVVWVGSFTAPAAGPYRAVINQAVTAGSRIYYRNTTGSGGMNYTFGGACYYFVHAEYNGTLGDTVNQQSNVGVTVAMMVEYGDEATLRPVYHATIAPSEVTGSPEATNSVRTALNDWIRTTPGPLTGYLELADVTETARNTGLWKPTYTTDLIHEDADGYAAIEAANLLPTLS